LKPPASAGRGAKPSLLGTTTDSKAGEVNGFGIYQVWWPVSPKGTAVKK
jgi:hypothetical protein